MDTREHALDHRPRDDALSVAALARALRLHWPEYLMEAWGLGVFMVSAGLFTTLLEYPGSPAHAAIADADLRRALIGLAMGLTAVGIIYSPWGQRSGAHLNPAVTLTFLRLGKVAPADAAFYIAAQFIGGTIGVLLVLAALGPAFGDPPVLYVATLPGAAGVGVAAVAEFAISFGLMLTVLAVSNSVRHARLTGVAAGILVAAYIAFEAPLCGMSMNPARTFASAAPGAVWTHLWIYFTAPVAGMLAAAALYGRLGRRARCAKLDHSPRQRCIHCGYEPPPAPRRPT
ncbi:MAG: MIP/aquaporin family protein [Pseudomonadota bacterium]